MAGYSSDKKALLDRLRRIEGQIRGLQRMVEEDQYCIDILTQVNSATAALREGEHRAGHRRPEGRGAAGCGRPVRREAGMSATMEHTAEAVRELRLDVIGMTCGSCAARVEKTLNRQPGVEASVNFATGEAVVRIAGEAPAFEVLREAVRARGYDLR